MRGTVVPWDRAKHRPELRDKTWDMYEMDPETTCPITVVELTPSAVNDELPYFLREALEREALEAEKRGRTADAPTWKATGKAPKKLLYAEEVADGRPELTPAEYRLLMAMWRYADNSTLGGIFPGHSRLAAQVGLSGKSGRDTVRTRIGSLIRKGYLVKVRDGRTVPTRLAAEYRLTLPEWEQGSPS